MGSEAMRRRWLNMKDFIASTIRRQPSRIADLLHPGAENAIPRRESIALTGFTDRELRRMIEAERRRGVPILSNCVGGYYLPADDTERKRFVNSMLHRAMEIAAVAAAVELTEE